jgi:hypothetical protein
MPTFQPSAYSSYGEVDTTLPEGATPADRLEQYAPLLTDLLFSQDDRAKLEKKKANLEAIQELHAKASAGALRNLYAWQINKLSGEIKALEELAGEERISVWTTQAGKISGTLLLLGGTVTALTIAWFFVQKGKEAGRK